MNSNISLKVFNRYNTFRDFEKVVWGARESPPSPPPNAKIILTQTFYENYARPIIISGSIKYRFRWPLFAWLIVASVATALADEQNGLCSNPGPRRNKRSLQTIAGTWWCWVCSPLRSLIGGQRDWKPSIDWYFFWRTSYHEGHWRWTQ